LFLYPLLIKVDANFHISIDVKIICYLGVIEKWHKKEGDLIKREDVICDIRTKVIISVYD